MRSNPDHPIRNGSKGKKAMTDIQKLKGTVKVCMFDQYGTVVDMQGGLVKIATPFPRRRAGPATRTPSSPGGAGLTSRTP